MKIIVLNEEELHGVLGKNIESCVMALGFFDGLHLGHQEVIRQAKVEANKRNLPLAIMSFFPHPKTVLMKRSDFPYLMPLEEKKKRMSSLGVDLFYVVPFNHAFASLSPEAFVKQYLLTLGVKHAVAGFDFHYGNKGVGHMARLATDSGYQITTTSVSKLSRNGLKISSSYIRSCLQQGEVDLANALLGRPYQVKLQRNGSTYWVKPFYTLPALGEYEVNCQGDMHTVKVLSKEEVEWQSNKALPKELSIHWLKKTDAKEQIS